MSTTSRLRIPAASVAQAGLEELIQNARRLLVLTGAGCSTGSGIPDYRDRNGAWKLKPPVRYQAFIGSESVRKRYWARSMVGFELVSTAKPNVAHRALAELEARGPLRYLVTQNVDGLHQKAGSRRVNDLHGRIDQVRCLDCNDRTPRVDLQERLRESNPGWDSSGRASYAPDGDADIGAVDVERFHIPACRRCGGMLKPDVVFFGESVPKGRVDETMAEVDAADAVLVVGSSLMVWSGFRFVKRAAENGTLTACVNLGKTRADELLSLKVESDCGEAMSGLVRRLRLNSSDEPG